MNPSFQEVASTIKKAGDDTTGQKAGFDTLDIIKALFRGMVKLGDNVPAKDPAVAAAELLIAEAGSNRAKLKNIFSIQDPAAQINEAENNALNTINQYANVKAAMPFQKEMQDRLTPLKDQVGKTSELRKELLEKQEKIKEELEKKLRDLFGKNQGNVSKSDLIKELGPTIKELTNLTAAIEKLLPSEKTLLQELTGLNRQAGQTLAAAEGKAYQPPAGEASRISK